MARSGYRGGRPLSRLDVHSSPNCLANVGPAFSFARLMPLNALSAADTKITGSGSPGTWHTQSVLA